MFSITFRESVEIFHVFSIVFQASTGKKQAGKNCGRNYGTRKFDLNIPLLSTRIVRLNPGLYGKKIPYHVLLFYL